MTYNCYFASHSPSGCTFWGKKPWSRKKKLLWQLGTLVGAPVGIALVAGIAVPAMIIGTVKHKIQKLKYEYQVAFFCFHRNTGMGWPKDSHPISFGRKTQTELCCVGRCGCFGEYFCFKLNMC